MNPTNSFLISITFLVCMVIIGVYRIWTIRRCEKKGHVWIQKRNKYQCFLCGKNFWE